MKPKILILTLLAVITGLLGAYLVWQRASTPASISKNLVIGTVAGYAPFVSMNAQGILEGFDIDVAHALAQQMNTPVEIRDLGSMTSLFMALEQGTIDMIIWGLSITQDRLKKVAMICYQGETTSSYPLIFWQTIPTGVHSMQDMQGRIVCVEPNSSQDAVLSKYTGIEKFSTERVDDALLNLQYGKAAAAFVEPAIAKKFKARYPEIQILEVPLALEDQVQGIGIAIKQNNTEFINKVQHAVNALKAQGTIDKLVAKWEIE